MEERLTLTSKELKRLRALELVEAERMTVTEAARLLGISERQCWRMLARYREQGAAGLVHGNRRDAEKVNPASDSARVPAPPELAFDVRLAAG